MNIQVTETTPQRNESPYSTFSKRSPDESPPVFNIIRIISPRVAIIISITTWLFINTLKIAAANNGVKTLRAQVDTR